MHFALIPMASALGQIPPSSSNSGQNSRDCYPASMILLRVSKLSIFSKKDDFQLQGQIMEVQRESDMQVFRLLQ
jgi:hypothetical protein